MLLDSETGQPDRSDDHARGAGSATRRATQPRRRDGAAVPSKRGALRESGRVHRPARVPDRRGTRGDAGARGAVQLSRGSTLTSHPAGVGACSCADVPACPSSSSSSRSSARGCGDAGEPGRLAAPDSIRPVDADQEDDQREQREHRHRECSGLASAPARRPGTGSVRRSGRRAAPSARRAASPGSTRRHSRSRARRWPIGAQGRRCGDAKR